MSYTKNEIAEATAMRVLTRAILNRRSDRTSFEVSELVKALKENEENAVADERYHLAEVFKEEHDKLLK